MASQQITDFGYEIFLTPRSSTEQDNECIYTGITVHSPVADVSAQVNQFCKDRGLIVSEYCVRKDFIIY